MADKLMRAVRSAVGPDGGPADAELLRRFAATRDAGAFELLVWRHAGMAKAAAAAVLRDKHLAEDAAQAAFLALARQAGRVRDNPAGWLYRVSRRVAVRMRRPVGRAVPDVPEDVRHSPTDDADELAALHDELARLPDRYRLPVLLCHLEGLSHADAAARLGWPVGTVAGRLSRARDRLRTRLTRRGLAPGLVLLTVAGDGPFAAATTRAAVAFAAGDVAGVSPTVLPLAYGALRAMTLAKLKLVAGVVLAFGTLTVGGVWAGGQEPPAAAPGERAAFEEPRRAADAVQWRRSRSNTRQIAEAAKAHLDGYRYMACNYTTDDGTPLLSWRVRLLPFLGYEALFRRFNLREPWDSPANKPLLAEMPPVYRTGFQTATATDTYYQAVAGPDSLFDPAGKKIWPELLELTRRADATVVCVEAGTPVAWTKPADLAYRADGPPPDARAPFAEVVHVVMADGRAYPLRRDKADATVWRGWLDRRESNPLWRNGRLADPPPADPAADRAEATRLRADTLALLARLEARVKQAGPQPSPQDVDRLDETNFALRRLVDEWLAEQPAAKK